MARKVRVQYPVAIHHVMSRGDHREKIFLDEEDHLLFLTTLEEEFKPVRRGWCLDLKWAGLRNGWPWEVEAIWYIRFTATAKALPQETTTSEPWEYDIIIDTFSFGPLGPIQTRIPDRSVLFSRLLTRPRKPLIRSPPRHRFDFLSH